MGKQIQIVGANNAPYVAKELDLYTGNQFTFAKPDGTDVVEIGALDFIRAIKNFDNFKDWVVNYKRDENTVIPLKIDKIVKSETGAGNIVEVKLNKSELPTSDGNYQINFDGTLESTNVSTCIHYEVASGGASKTIVYGIGQYHNDLRLNISSEGDIALEELDNELTAESFTNRISKLYSANITGDIITLMMYPFNEEPVIGGDTPKHKITYYFTNDDVDVSAITLVKLTVEYVEEDDEINAEYVDETKEIEAGTVLPTPSGDDDGKVLGVAGGEYALSNIQVSSFSPVAMGMSASLSVNDIRNALGTDEYSITLGFIKFYRKTYYVYISENKTGAGYFYYDGVVLPMFDKDANTTHAVYLGTKTFFSSSDLDGNILEQLPKHEYLPPLPNDAAEKTYNLKAVNGVLDWVE